MWTLCFLPCGFFFLSSSFVFPRLLSAVADWMSTILRHMVWPWWEFRMQAWNVLHAARWKYRTQKIAKNLPSVHHCTTFSGYIFAAKARIDNWKKVVKQQYLPHMSSQYGELGPLAAEISSVVFGHPCKFQLVSHLGFVTAATSLNGSQPNFARSLALTWAGRLYTVSQKAVQNCFCQNFFKFAPVLIFLQKDGKEANIMWGALISTLPNSHHHTTVLSADVPNCYTVLSSRGVVI